MQPHYYIGLDLGQASEATAWAIVERPATAATEPVYSLRYLDRFALGAPFARIAKDVAGLVAKLPVQEDWPTLIIDQTSVGRPVIELLQRTPMSVHVRIACITAGQQASKLENGTLLVPKIELISGLQVLLQGRRLQVARGLPLANLLTRELQNFRMKVSLASGGDNLAAWRENQNDDLVYAVALACWIAEREPPLGPDAFSTGEFSGLSIMAHAPREVSLTANLLDDDEEGDW